jgi:hypothetical protein
MSSTEFFKSIFEFLSGGIPDAECMLYWTQGHMMTTASGIVLPRTSVIAVLRDTFAFPFS